MALVYVLLLHLEKHHGRLAPQLSELVYQYHISEHCERHPPMTVARITTLQADPSKVDDAVQYFRDEALPEVRRYQGFEGARFLVNRQSGRCQIVTLWASESAARASDSSVNVSRERLAQLIGASQPTVDLLEMAINVSA